MELREYQKIAISMVIRSIKDGFKRPVVAAPTGFGKTVVAAEILKRCQKQGKIAWFICDRIRLVEQTAGMLDKFGIDFGVRQAQHVLTDTEKTIQIVSAQTLSALLKKNGNTIPPFDLLIIDECHIQHKVYKEIKEQYNAIPILGLSATPYAKGMGNFFDNLLIPISTRELEDLGFLCPTKYYIGAHIDTKRLRSKNPNEFDSKHVEEMTDEDSDRLSGGIIKNYLEYGQGAQAIAFCPTIALSKKLVEILNNNGIYAEHIDCYTDEEKKQELYEAHDRGEFKVLCCSRLLNTGYDAPRVSCIIDCYPVKSITTWQQRAGRIKRIFPGKEVSTYLDHADNFSRFGFPEDIIPEKLCTKKKGDSHSQRDSTNKKTDPKTMECPECLQLMIIPCCQACGYEMSQQEQMEDDGRLLVEAGDGETDEVIAKKANKTDPTEIKTQFYSELIHLGELRGYKRGWAPSQYREKYDVWPNKITPYTVTTVSPMTMGWLEHRRIKWQKSRKAS